MLRGKAAAAAAGVDNVCDEESRWASLVATIERERQKCEPSSGHYIFPQRANGTFPASARDFVRYPKLATMMLFFAFSSSRQSTRPRPSQTAGRRTVARTASLARRYVRARAGGREVDGQSTFLHPPQTRTKQRETGGAKRDVGGSEERAPSAAANDIIELRARFPPRSLSPFEVPRRVCLIVVRRYADVSGRCRMHYRHRLRRYFDRPRPPSRPRTDRTE